MQSRDRGDGEEEDDDTRLLAAPPVGDAFSSPRSGGVAADRDGDGDERLMAASGGRTALAPPEP